MTEKMKSFLNSNEFKRFQDSLLKIIEYNKSGLNDKDLEAALIDENKNYALFTSIHLGSSYPKPESKDKKKTNEY